METLSIGTHKGSPRKSLYGLRPAEEDVIGNKKKGGGGQRSELIRRTSDGDMVALSFNGTDSPKERKAIGSKQSSLAKEDRDDSFVSRGVRPKDISNIAKMILFPLSIDTQFFTDQNMIGKVTPDMTGYAINKYREAWAYRRWAVTTLEVYA